VHFWPFDGWSVPPNRSVVAEVYPALWNRTLPSGAGRTPDQQDAFAIAKWLQSADCDGSLEKYFCLHIEPHERKRLRLRAGFSVFCSVLRQEAERRDGLLFDLFPDHAFPDNLRLTAHMRAPTFSALRATITASL
jgi:hypothetical protein